MVYQEARLQNEATPAAGAPSVITASIDEKPGVPQAWIVAQFGGWRTPSCDKSGSSPKPNSKPLRRAYCNCGTMSAGTYMQRRRPWSVKERMKARCLPPRAQAAQLGRIQGLRISAMEPLMAGQSFSSWRRKFRCRAESSDLERGMLYVYHIIYILQAKKINNLFWSVFPPSLRHYESRGFFLAARRIASAPAQNHP